MTLRDLVTGSGAGRRGGARLLAAAETVTVPGPTGGIRGESS